MGSRVRGNDKWGAGAWAKPMLASDGIGGADPPAGLARVRALLTDAKSVCVATRGRA